MSRLAQLEKLLAADPADADVLYMLAQEHAKAGHHAGAIEWYDRCVEADPRYVYAFFHKARVQQAAGDAVGAAATAREGLARARGLGHAKAANELAGLLEELEG